jgi:histidine triad (HIT) family protein
MIDSIFTKILKGGMPSIKVYEDELVFVLMDKFPSTEGQVLVITKEQIDYIFDLPDELYTHLWLVTKKVAFALEKAFNPRRVCTVVEGFDVPHVHIRVYPVPEGKPLDIKAGEIADDTELEELAKKIRAELL